MDYDTSLCAELLERIQGESLRISVPRMRYDPGELVDWEARGILGPAASMPVRFEVEKFLGSGFAGQVYRCRLVEFPGKSREEPPEGLVVGRLYAVKILVPASRFALAFRNFLHWLGYQAPFLAQVHPEACRRGLLWQKLLRAAAGFRFGRSDAVKDVFAWFFDARIGAYGEITEWVEGRSWRLEADDRLFLRRRWRELAPEQTQSPEYVAKRRFMAEMTRLLRDMGGREFARQYEWWTMKSQPNVLKRTGVGDGPADGLCAIDFRAGLVLLPFLPMSPADFALILEGLLFHGRVVQFDRCDLRKFRGFIQAHLSEHPELGPLAREFQASDQVYRRAQPDIFHQGLRLLWDRSLRNDVRNGLIQGYRVELGISTEFAGKLQQSALRFLLFYLLGVLPVFGRVLRKFWGAPDWRAHVLRMGTDFPYFLRAGRVRVYRGVLRWVRTGRAGPDHARTLADHPLLYWLERFTAGLAPAPGLHRALADPGFLKSRFIEWYGFIRRFYRDPAFRRGYLVSLVEEGAEQGMLSAAERDAIIARVDEPFIIRYLQALAVHFATLPVTQIVSVVVGLVLAGVILTHGHWSSEAWTQAGAAFTATLIVFQITPVSPGSACRGAYVVYLAIRDRDFLSYLIALPVAFLKYFGYLAFPLQMATTYPELSRFMAARWATSAVRFVPVFGERGGLFEHYVFDAMFNLPRMLGRWCRPRLAYLLDAWMLAALAFWAWFWVRWQPSFLDKRGFNITLIVLVLGVFPRLLFFPLLRRRSARTAPARSGRRD